MTDKSFKKLSRRDFLKFTGPAAAGALLAACAPAATEAPEPAEAPVVNPTEAPLTATEAPVAKPVEGNVVVMHRANELSADQIASFQEANPGITIEFVEDDPTRFYAMYAAGAPPDIYRIQAPSVPGMLARKLLLDLTPYFESSDLIKVDDLAPANNYYKANSPLEIGTKQGRPIKKGPS